MKARMLMVCLIIVVGHVWAQKAPLKYGDASLEEVKMTRFEQDTAAAAVVLFDYGESSIVYSQQLGFSLEFSRITRIKILKKDGYEWANFEIPLYKSGSSKEKLFGLKGVTYNLVNGKVEETKLKNDGIFEESVSKNLELTKVTLPNVKEGSVVEITYRVLSDFIFNFQDWEFQSQIPTLHSEYRARIPEYFNYDKYMQGYVQLALSDQKQYSSSIVVSGQGDKLDFQETRFQWVAKNVPAFKSEPFITTYRDYISKINFELAYTKFPNQPIKTYMGTWEDINKQYYDDEDFGAQVRGNGFLKKTVEEIAATATSKEQIIAGVMNYVKANVTWDGTSGRYVRTSLRKVLDEKKGNAGEINLLIASMLEKADIEVAPVLLSTRDHGFVRETIPISSQFNYVVCLAKMGDNYVLLDGTDKFLPVGVLPERCLNGRGFVIRKDMGTWVSLSSPTKSRTFISCDLKLSSEGQLDGKISYERLGYDAASSRKEYFNKGEKEYVKSVHEGKLWDISNTQFENAKEIHEPFKEVHELVINEHVTSAGDVLYLSPFVVERMSTNPFKLENREYPVDFGKPFEMTILAKIAIPEGYAVEELPQSKMLLLPDKGGKYIYSVSQVGNLLNFTSSLIISQSLYTQKEYPNLREFYSQVVAKQAEQIVLKKK